VRKCCLNRFACVYSRNHIFHLKLGSDGCESDSDLGKITVNIDSVQIYKIPKHKVRETPNIDDDHMPVDERTKELVDHRAQYVL
jgi:hypothetical protein